MQTTIITGKRHHGECYCGCRYVDGITGTIVQDGDTPKLARMPEPMLIGASEPERFESMRPFTPAPTQITGQMTF